MSLVDALLLEPYRDPREVYIALRSDGQKGSGTIDDPYDGGTRLGPGLQASLTFKGRQFVLSTNFANGLQPDSVVTITNARGPAAAWFNKSFKVVEKLSALHVLLSFDYLDGQTAPSGNPPAPPDVPYSFNDYIYVNYADSTENIHKTLPTIAHIYWPIARVTVPANHGLKVFDAVTVGNVSPIDYQGDYPILGPLSPTGTGFAYRLRFLPGSDVTTPINCTVTRRIHRYDEVMRAAPFPSVIHLGPGLFETRGAAPIYVANATDYTQLHTGCIIRAGQRLLGSGMGVTTLKLVLPVDDLNQTTAIGNYSYPNADGAEVSDLTVDCNADGHAAPHGTFPAPVTCGAVGLGGSFIHIHRVRAIHFCTQARAECFVLGAGASDHGTVPTFNVLEDCIMEEPGRNNTHETTLLINGGSVYGSTISPIVRHNYANCNYVDPLDDSAVSSRFVAVASLAQHILPPFNPPEFELFTLATKLPHRRIAGQNIHLAGVVGFPGGAPYLNFPVVEKIDDFTLVFKVVGTTAALSGIDVSKAYIGVDYHAPGAFSGTGCVTEGNAVFDCPEAYYADTGSTRDTVVRDNYYSGIFHGANFSFDSGGFGGADVIFARTGVNLLALTHSGLTANANSGSPGTPGTGVPHGLIEGETVQISGALIGGIPAPAGTYNGNYPVHVVDSYNFTYSLVNIPTGGDGGNADVPDAAAPILVGIYSLTRDANNPKIAILASAQPHQCKAGDVVRIQGAKKNGDLIPPGQSYNADVNVLSVITDKVFTYEMKNDPGGDADASTTTFTISFQSRYQVRRFIYENNICDLSTFDINFANLSVLPRGMHTIVIKDHPPFLFPSAIIRDNAFQHIDQTPAVVGADGSYLFALRLGSFDNTMIDGNLVGMSNAHSIHYMNSGTVNAFNNRIPNGSTVPLFEDVGGGAVGAWEKQDSLEDKINDSVVMALL